MTSSCCGGAWSSLGYQIDAQKTHDELDAVTSALVGHFYLADQYEAIGADDEGYMIIPRSAIAWPNGGGTAGARRPTAFLIGLPGAGKTTLSRALTQRLGMAVLCSRRRPSRTCPGADPRLQATLAAGDLAPEPLIRDLVSEAAAFGPEPGLLIDGFPRHPEQLPLAEELFPDWIAPFISTYRCRPPFLGLRNRLVCGSCGSVKLAGADPQRPCPVCGAATWRTRIEDDDSGIPRRVQRIRAIPTTTAPGFECPKDHSRGCRADRRESCGPRRQRLDAHAAHVADVCGGGCSPSLTTNLLFILLKFIEGGASSAQYDLLVAPIPNQLV